MLQDAGMKQDKELKRAFRQAGAAGGLRDSCSLIASMHRSPGPLGRSLDTWNAQPRGPAQQHPAVQDNALMRDVTNQVMQDSARAQHLPGRSESAQGNRHSAQEEHCGITPLLGQSLRLALIAALDFESRCIPLSEQAWS